MSSEDELALLAGKKPNAPSVCDPENLMCEPRHQLELDGRRVTVVDLVVLLPAQDRRSAHPQPLRQLVNGAASANPGELHLAGLRST